MFFILLDRRAKKNTRGVNTIVVQNHVSAVFLETFEVKGRANIVYITLKEMPSLLQISISKYLGGGENGTPHPVVFCKTAKKVREANTLRLRGVTSCLLEQITEAFEWKT